MPITPRSLRTKKPSTKARANTTTQKAATPRARQQKKKSVTWADGQSQAPAAPPAAPRAPLLEPIPLPDSSPVPFPPQQPPPPLPPRPQSPTPERTPVEHIPLSPPEVPILVSGNYTLRVNKKNTITKRPYFPLEHLAFSDIKVLIEEMTRQKGSGIQDGIYTITSCTLRVRMPKKNWEKISISNFSVNDEEEFLAFVRSLLPDPYPRGSAIELQIEIDIDAPASKPAFRRNQSANKPDMSSDPTIQPTRRTGQLLDNYATITGDNRAANRERRNLHNIDVHTKTREWEHKLHQHWRCDNRDCINKDQYCYTRNGGREHYQITPADAKSWATSIAIGTALLKTPAGTLLDYFLSSRSGGNQKRSKQSKQHKKRRRSSSYSGSDSDDGRAITRQIKQLKRQLTISLLQGQVNQTAAATAQPLPYTLAPLPVSQYMLPPPAYMPIGYSGYHPILQHPQPTVPTVPTAGTEPVCLNTPPEQVSVPSSSPVNGKIDTQKDVVDFFAWVIPQQPDDLQQAYVKVQDVIVSEGWTVDDIKAMSDRNSPMYAQAIGEPHNLKEGIIRHLRQEFLWFKLELKEQAAATAAAAAGLQALGSGFL
ncbi:hypothetical protein EJ04DRAFT_520560 [Polyplosphaeria fusca]|uniref:Uncharacterized protein n=1 Tax=Polyplosphaeria fusca TaxID=682080 RepID=A0A9P4V324_9PLEO|nr:hypothetical protein EJ04DRAFT_520560 [Polyplosphaeria fusca]